MRHARLILLCYSLSLTAGPALAQPAPASSQLRSQSTQLAQQVNAGGDKGNFLKAILARISPPQSGVKLLEELFQRVRSVPQIAMAKNLMQQQEAQNNMLKLAQAPSDQNLMIRPQVVGKQAQMPQRALSLAATNAGPAGHTMDGKLLVANAPGAQSGYPAGGGGGVGGTATGSRGNADSYSLPAPPPTVQVYMGSRQYPMSASGEGNGRGMWTNTSTLDAKEPASPKGTWYSAPREMQITDERPVVRDFKEAPQASGIPLVNSNKASDRAANRYAYAANSASQLAAPASVAAPAQPPDLGTAASRLYKLSSALQSLQQGHDAGPLDNMFKSAEQQELKQAVTAGYAGKDRSSTLRNGVSTGSPHGTYGAVAGLPPPEASYNRGFIVAPNLQGATNGTIGPQGVEAQYVHGTVSRERRSQMAGKTTKSARKKSALARNEKFAAADDLEEDALPNSRNANKIAMSESSIAALPPNVVTGIPLVRLGISETQAATALRAVGTTTQDMVEKWRVLSWRRNNNKTQTALQLYMRNGQLDAMRIFDPSLIAPDFGVSMGDDVGRVKEKFGEPAFILAEPGPGAGQNYIYPISQVGFQLSRSTPGQQPRVVSVLIFNVK